MSLQEHLFPRGHQYWLTYIAHTITHPFGMIQKDLFPSALPQKVRANRRLEVVSHGYRLEMAPDNVLVRNLSAVLSSNLLLAIANF
jgi:hypothetical protein